MTTDKPSMPLAAPPPHTHTAKRISPWLGVGKVSVRSQIVLGGWFFVCVCYDPCSLCPDHSTRLLYSNKTL